MPPLAAPLLVLTLVASAAAFAAYGLDKRRARRGGRRLRERTLQGLAAAGGWPGALLARRVFRHKTRKRAFTVGLALISLAHVALWTLLLGS